MLATSVLAFHCNNNECLSFSICNKCARKRHNSIPTRPIFVARCAERLIYAIKVSMVVWQHCLVALRSVWLRFQIWLFPSIKSDCEKYADWLWPPVRRCAVVPLTFMFPPWKRFRKSFTKFFANHFDLRGC